MSFQDQVQNTLKTNGYLKVKTDASQHDIELSGVIENETDNQPRDLSQQSYAQLSELQNILKESLYLIFRIFLYVYGCVSMLYFGKSCYNLDVIGITDHGMEVLYAIATVKAIIKLELYSIKWSLALLGYHLAFQLLWTIYFFTADAQYFDFITFHYLFYAIFSFLFFGYSTYKIEQILRQIDVLKQVEISP